MAWYSSDIFKGGITAIIGALATVFYKKLRPSLQYLKKVIQATDRVEQLLDDVAIIKSRKIAIYHTDINPIVIKNTKGEVTYVNPAFVEMAGFDTQAEACGYGYTTAIHPLDDAMATKERQIQIDHPSEKHGYIRFKNKKTGHTIFTMYRTQLVRNYKNELVETLIRLYVIKE